MSQLEKKEMCVSILLYKGDAMKRKVITNMNKKEITKLFERLIIDDIDVYSVAAVLSCSTRTVYRMKNKYIANGAQGLIHANKGSTPHNLINLETKKRIIDLYLSEKFKNSNFSHFQELIHEMYGIKVSVSFIHSLLKSKLICSKKAQKATKKAFKKAIKDYDKAQATGNSIKSPIIPPPIPKRVFARRNRKSSFGELLQMDASVHEWIKGVKWHLHIAIDDATGIITSAFFDKQETLFAYQTIMIDTINKYGIPRQVMTDRRSVFTNNKKHEHPALTQFGYSCSLIGTKITVTSIPQTKGKVERSFNTHQDRLITELSINGIDSIEAANKYLAIYIKRHNDKFAASINYTLNVFKSANNFDLNVVFAKRYIRKTDQGGSFKLNNAHYLIVDAEGKAIGYRSGREIIVNITFHGKIYVTVDKTDHYVKILNSKCNYSLGYTPNNIHPWKISFSTYSQLKRNQDNIKALF
jgi:transposase